MVGWADARPPGSITEPASRHGASRCVLYPEKARAMREDEEVRDLARKMLAAPRPRLLVALRIVEGRLAKERAAKEAP